MATNCAAEARTEGLGIRLRDILRWQAKAAGIEGNVRGRSLWVGSAGSFAEDVLRQPPGMPDVCGTSLRFHQAVDATALESVPGESSLNALAYTMRRAIQP